MKTIKLFCLALVAAASLTGCSKTPDTNLEITVHDYNGNPVKNAEVYLYRSEADWQNEENLVSGSVHVTNDSGRVTYYDLVAVKHYFDVLSEDKTMGNSDVVTLTEGEMNKVTTEIW